jgi:type IV pilus assembly protein PilE
MNMKHKRRLQAGFTLVELVVTMAILGILVSIAIPAYTSYVQKGNRPSAKTALLELASRQESYYALNNAYASQATTLGYSVSSIPVPSSSQNYYTVTVASVSSGTVPGYTLQATPVTGSVQASDACAIYQLDHLGNKSNVTSAGAAVSTSNCW